MDPSLGLLGVLLEPTTVVTKAWEQVVAIGLRAFWDPRALLATGAGPIGLLAALVAKQHGMEVHVLDRVESGPKPELVRGLGATYHSGRVQDLGFEPDVIIECTGVGQVIADSIRGVSSGGIVCLTGVGSGGSTAGPAVADVAAAVVLKNNAIVGGVNANNVEMKMNSFPVRYLHSFELLGKSGRVELWQAYQEARWEGTFNGVPASTSRSGWSDMSLRLAMNLIGAPSVAIVTLSDLNWESCTTEANGQQRQRSPLGWEASVGYPFSPQLGLKLAYIGLRTLVPVGADSDSLAKGLSLLW